MNRERALDFAGRLAPLLVVAGVAAGLRFFDLGYRSLWLDEVSTAQAVRFQDLSTVLGYVARDNSATPLMYVVTWLLRPIGGDEFAIRVPYAVAGILAVIALYALAARLYGRPAGIVAGALMAILPNAIFYSQEARSYAFLMLLTTVMMLAAHRAVTVGRTRDWVALAAAGVLDLYTGYLALGVLIAAYGYVGLVLAGNFVNDWRVSGRRAALKTSTRPAAMAALSGVLIIIAFLPWIRHLKAFLVNRDQAFGRVASGYQPTLEEARALLQQLDLHGIVFWLLIAGIATVVIDLAFGKWKRSLLLLVWFFVPLLGFVIGAGGGIVAIWPRYFGTVYPAAILLAAVGIDGLARVIGFAVRIGSGIVSSLSHGGRTALSAPRPARLEPIARVAVLAGLCALVALDALPADAAAYTRAKGSDYRGAVDTMLAQDPAHPVVLVVGDNPDWTVSGLGYYSWVRGSRLTVLDALKLNADTLKVLEAASTVWAAVLGPTGLPGPSTPDMEASLFADVWLVRQVASPASAIDQAQSLLTWVASFEPQMTATSRLIDLLEGHGTLGSELLPPPRAAQPQDPAPAVDRWILQPGASLGADGSFFTLQPGGGSINVYLTTTALKPGAQYVMSFSCRASRLVGFANVFVVANGPAGQTAFPDGAGYPCLGSSDPDHGVFAFTMPAGATSATVWLRATGSGSAGYEDISLRSFE